MVEFVWNVGILLLNENDTAQGGRSRLTGRVFMREEKSSQCKGRSAHGYVDEDKGHVAFIDSKAVAIAEIIKVLRNKGLLLT